MRKPITVVQMIPVDGVYHPMEALEAGELERIRRQSPEEKISGEPVSEQELGGFRRSAAERVRRRLTEYYTAHPEELVQL